MVCVWEVVGISRIERTNPRLYRCYRASGELVFEAGEMHEAIFKYRYFFDRGEL